MLPNVNSMWDFKVDKTTLFPPKYFLILIEGTLSGWIIFLKDSLRIDLMSTYYF
jgi:cytidylate kinase